MHFQNDDPKEPGPVRRPYEAPAIVETADFETLALACNQTFGTCQPGADFPDAEPSS
jgi:hypothetical protein